MSKGSVSLPEAQRLLLARVVQEQGVRVVCEAAGIRSPQSLFRALAGAPVLSLTLLALQRTCEQFAVAGSQKDRAGGSAA
jgi:hypothetical protein